MMTAPGRFVSGAVFRNEGRQTFEPPAQIICENDSAAPALDGAKLTGSNCVVDGRSACLRRLARFTDVISKLFLEHCSHRFAGYTPATVAAHAGK